MNSTKPRSHSLWLKAAGITMALSTLILTLSISPQANAAKKKKKSSKTAPVEESVPVMIPSFPKEEAKLWDYIQTKVREKNYYALLAAEQYKNLHSHSPRFHDLAVQMKEFAFQGIHYNSYKQWLEISKQSDPLFWIRTGEWESLQNHELTPYGSQLRYAVELYGQTDRFLENYKDISQSPWYWALYLRDPKNDSPTESQRNGILEDLQFPENPSEKDDWAEVIIKLSLLKIQDFRTSDALKTYEKRRQELQKIIDSGTAEAGLYSLAVIIQLQSELKEKYVALGSSASKLQEVELQKLNLLIEANKKECEIFTKRNIVFVEAHKICESEIVPKDIFEERIPNVIKIPTTSRVAFLGLQNNQNEIIKTLMKYINEGNLGWVWHYLETQNKINPQDPWWMAQLGTFYLYINKWRDAEKLFAQSVLIDRFQPAAWKGRAFADTRFNYDQQARVAWMRSQKQKPNLSIDLPSRLEDLEKYKKKKKRFPRARGKAKKKK